MVILKEPNHKVGMFTLQPLPASGRGCFLSRTKSPPAVAVPNQTSTLAPKQTEPHNYTKNAPATTEALCYETTTLQLGKSQTVRQHLLVRSTTTSDRVVNKQSYDRAQNSNDNTTDA